MKASLLINAVTIAAVTKKIFTVSDAPALLFQSGLAGTESIALEFLASGADPDTADDGDWEAYKVGGTAKVLDVDNTVLEITVPGNYRIVTGGTTANPLTVGVYGNH